MSQTAIGPTGTASDRPFGVAVLCGLNGFGAAGILVFVVRALANGRPGIGALGVGVLLVTALVVLGLWNTYTWGWELGVAYYATVLVLGLATAAILVARLGQVLWWMAPAPAVSIASLAYLLAARDAFGEH